MQSLNLSSEPSICSTPRPVTSDVVIVGAGHNGLVAAFYLGRAGLSVEVIEALPMIGGACKTEELIPGYKFSTCANELLWLRPRVAEDMALVSRGLVVAPADTESRILSATRGITFHDHRRELDHVGAAITSAHAAWTDWNDFWAQGVDLFGPFLLSHPPGGTQIAARARELGSTAFLERIRRFTLGELADQHLKDHPDLRSCVDPPHDIGSLYERGSALAMAIATAASAYSETGQNSPRGYVNGGMGTVTQLMMQAAADHGVKLRAGTPVERVVIEKGRVSGVLLAGGEIVEATTVVLNVDVKRAFRTLIPSSDLPEGLPERVGHLTTNVAPLKFHCALADLPEFSPFGPATVPARGNVVISPTAAYWQDAWDEARKGDLPTAPHIDIMTPSYWDPDLAPAGCHTVSFWILFAPVKLKVGTWPERREEMAHRLIDIVSTYSPNFRHALRDYVLLTPWDLEERVQLTNGNIHHVDFAGEQILAGRPLPELAGYATPVPGLYLCGAGQHPYGEVTGAPGYNAAHTVLEQLGVSTTPWQEISRIEVKG
jgi:phytoene dehydrogenase-like protein